MRWREPRSLRTLNLSASEWVLRNVDDADAMASATRFGDHLARLLAFDGVGGDAASGEQPQWGPLLDG